MLTKRSILLKEKVTSISLEAGYWDEIDRRASQNGIPWQDYMRRLLSGIQEDVVNRSSAVRETLLNLLKKEAGNCRLVLLESWWLVKTPAGSREVGTRGKRLLLGRGSMNDLIIDDKEVSRRHLMMVYDEKDWWGIDLDSKNGTFVGKKRVEIVKFYQGLVLSIGNSELTFLG